MVLFKRMRLALLPVAAVAAAGVTCVSCSGGSSGGGPPPPTTGVAVAPVAVQVGGRLDLPGLGVAVSDLRVRSFTGVASVDDTGAFSGLEVFTDGSSSGSLLFLEDATSGRVLTTVHAPASAVLQGFVTITSRELALGLLRTTPYLIGAAPDQEVAALGAAGAHPQFSSLEGEVEAWLGASPLQPLGAEAQPALFQLVGTVASEAVVANQGTVFAPATVPGGTRIGDEDLPHIVDLPGPELVLVNPKHCFYAADLGDGGEGTLVRGRDGWIDYQFPATFARGEPGMRTVDFGERTAIVTFYLGLDCFCPEWDDLDTAPGKATYANFLRMLVVIFKAIGIANPLASIGEMSNEQIEALLDGAEPLGEFPTLETRLERFLSVVEWVTDPDHPIRLARVQKILWGDVVFESIDQELEFLFMLHSWGELVHKVLDPISKFGAVTSLANDDIPFFKDIGFAPAKVTYVIRQQDGVATQLTAYTPPNVVLTASPNTAGTGQPIQFSIAGSSDDETPEAALEVRWDLNGDRVWDTDWITSHSFQRGYAKPGTYRVGAIVRDADGVAAEAEVEVVIREGASAAPPVIPAPELQVPAHGQTVITSAPQADLRWLPVPGAAGYQLQIDGSLNLDLPGLATHYTAKFNSSTGDHLWRMRTADPRGGHGPWSSTYRFSLRDASTGAGQSPSVPGSGHAYATAFRLPVGGLAPETHAWEDFPTENLDRWYVYTEFRKPSPHGFDQGTRHLGEDWNGEGWNDQGAPVVAVANGVVTQAGRYGDRWGYVVVVRHDAPPGAAFSLPGGGSASSVLSLYAHLQHVAVSEGDVVVIGGPIGEVGPTAEGSTAPHLHWELISDTNAAVPGVGYSSSDSGRVSPTEFVELNAGSVGAAGVTPPLAPPAPLDPPNGATVDASQPSHVLEWSRVAGATGYELDVDGNQVLIADPSQLSYLASLSSFGAHTWRIRSLDAGSPGPWSQLNAFELVSSSGSAPNAPQLSAPADGATGAGQTPTLSWNDPGGSSPLTYEVEVASQIDFASASLLATESGLTSTQWSPPNPLPGGQTCHWRVRATSSSGTSLWSGVRSFTVQSAPSATLPGAPQPSSPSDGASNQATTLDLSWSAPAAGTGPFTYDVWLALDSGFTTLIGASTGQTGTSWTAGVLANGQTYHWRVRANNAAGTGDWSSPRSFTVGAAAPNLPGAPALDSPSDGAANQPISVNLSWSAPATGAGPFTYDVWLALDSGFTTLIGASSDQSATNWTTATLSNNQTYHWRVRAKNAVGTGQWSSVRSFTVGAGGGGGQPNLTATISGVSTVGRGVVYTPASRCSARAARCPTGPTSWCGST